MIGTCRGSVGICALVPSDLLVVAAAASSSSSSFSSSFVAFLFFFFFVILKIEVGLRVDNDAFPFFFFAPRFPSVTIGPGLISSSRITFLESNRRRVPASGLKRENPSSFILPSVLVSLSSVASASASAPAASVASDEGPVLTITAFPSGPSTSRPLQAALNARNTSVKPICSLWILFHSSCFNRTVRSAFSASLRRRTRICPPSALSRRRVGYSSSMLSYRARRRKALHDGRRRDLPSRRSLRSRASTSSSSSFGLFWVSSPSTCCCC
mmetsp:Transcript_38426/g.83479  ORF Transcript_38426/g.83479 Transcript_38426/m.83479 type:complete len:269 (+) Transcript_38426:1278-2084(+)